MDIFLYIYSQIKDNHLTQYAYADRDKLRLWMTPQEIYYDYSGHQGHNPNNPKNYAEKLEPVNNLLVNVNKISMHGLATFINDQPFTLDNRKEDDIITVNRLYHLPFDRINIKMYPNLLDAEQHLVAYYLEKTKDGNITGKVKQETINDHQQILDFTYTKTNGNEEAVTGERFIINHTPIVDAKSHKDLGYNNLMH